VLPTGKSPLLLLDHIVNWNSPIYKINYQDLGNFEKSKESRRLIRQIDAAVALACRMKQIPVKAIASTSGKSLGCKGRNFPEIDLHLAIYFPCSYRYRWTLQQQ
jgi:hypothetical protein